MNNTQSIKHFNLKGCKYVVLFLLLIVASSFACFDVHAIDTSMICSTSSSGEVTLISYASSEPDIVLPDTFNGNPITKIAANAFNTEEVDNIESIVLPKHLKVIDSYAFNNCANLHTIKLNENLVSVGNYAFNGCSSLENVYIDSYEHLWSISFGSSYSNPVRYAKNIYINNVLIGNEITLPDNIDIIPDNAFTGWKSITKVTIPENVTEIGAKAFSQCTNLTEIVWNENILNINDYAFNGCSKLGPIVLPDSVQYIGNNAFYDCDNMKGIILGTNIKTIGNNVFDRYSLIGISYTGTEEQWNNISIGTLSTDIPIYFNVVDGVIAEGTCGDNTTWELDYKGSLVIGGTGDMEDYRYSSDVVWKEYEDCILSITISEGVTSIGNYAFYSTSVSDLTISNTVTRIGEYAFWCCFDLVDVFIPKNVEEIGDYALWATNIKTIEVDKDNRYFASKDDVLYNKDMTLLIQYAPEKENSAFRIPDTVTEIGARAFDSADNLRSLSFGTNVTTIGLQALYDLKNLSYIFFDGTSEEWQYSLPYQVYFELVTNSEYVEESYFTYAIFDETAIVIGASNLPENIAIPSSAKGYPVIAISGNVFANANIKTMSLPNTLQRIEAKAFYQCRELEEITMSDSLISIGDDAFYYCDNLTSIYLPETLTKIGSDAFRYCSSLENVYLDDIPSWWNVSFENDYSNPMHYAEFVYLNDTLLEEYVMPDDITSFPNNAFDGWSALKSITISKNVSVIPDSAFKDCTNLHTVIFHDGITDIEDKAFYNCTNLTYADVPATVNSIASNSFYNCKKLTTVTIPFGRTEITNSEFKDFANLKSVRLPESITIIRASAFEGCTNLETINFPEGLTEIEHFAFNKCSNLKAINLPTTLKKLSGSYIFAYCTSLESVTLPEGITEIDGNTFCYCTNLKSVSLPSTLEKLSGAYTFGWCTSLESIVIPNKVYAIPMGTFDGCTSLKSVLLSPNIESINVDSFKNCTNLESINIPSSVTLIDSTAFSNCKKLSTIYWDAENAFKMNNAFNNAGTDGITIIFGDSMQSIPKLTNMNITDIVFGKNILTIGKEAFKDSVNLKSVVITSDLSTIEDYAFSGCTNLAKVQLPNTVTKIGNYAFYNCYSISEINLPTSLTTVGNYAFCACSHIPEMDFTLTSLTSIGDYALYDCDAMKKVKFPTTLKTIGHDAFSSCFEIKNIVFPEGLTSIGADAFRACVKLESVTIPSSLKEVKARAFIGCNSLTKVYITDLKAWCEIDFGSYDANPCNEDASLYLNNELVTELVIPEGITEIKDHQFRCCKGLTDVTLPSTLRKIEGAAFAQSSITSIVVPEGVTEIGNGAFNWCAQLKTITLPKSLNSLGGSMTFAGCGSLTDIYYGGSDSTWNAAFAELVPSKVTVHFAEISVTGVSLDSSAITLANGKTKNLNATVTPSNATNTKLIWDSSNDDVVSVDNGVITATGLGSATITVTTEDGDYTDSCDVTVLDIVYYQLSGNVKSYGEDSTIRVELSNGTSSLMTSVVDNTYSFDEVEPGTYTLRISKSKHCTREYTVVVSDSNVTLDLEIWLYGDVNSDGTVNHIDVLQINRNIASQTSVFDAGTDELKAYRFNVANVTAINGSDTELNHIDVLQINRKIANLTSIFDSLE